LGTELLKQPKAVPVVFEAEERRDLGLAEVLDEAGADLVEDRIQRFEPLGMTRHVVSVTK
jgi:hypothetical protein